MSVRTRVSPQRAIWQVLVQAPVSELAAPASHVSTPTWTKLSPQLGSVQSLRQPSLLELLPSSQASTPAWTMPSPQRAATQPVRQASVLSVLPSSHASRGSPFGTPSPHLPSWQLAEQGAPGVPFAAPSSHCSAPRWTKPSPQVAALQVSTQASLFEALPSSHSSPVWTMPSKHSGVLHRFVQSSSFELLPSSQASTPACTLPSPQKASLQTTQPSVTSSLPSSHCSAG